MPDLLLCCCQTSCMLQAMAWYTTETQSRGISWADMRLPLLCFACQHHEFSCFEAASERKLHVPKVQECCLPC